VPDAFIDLAALRGTNNRLSQWKESFHRSDPEFYSNGSKPTGTEVFHTTKHLQREHGPSRKRAFDFISSLLRGTKQEHLRALSDFYIPENHKFFTGQEYLLCILY
jgi:hypothetical protein